VLENPAGKAVGIEVKASSTVKSSDFKGLKYLIDLLGDRFLRGIVLYTGDQPVPFGSNLYVLPVSTLWQDGKCLTRGQKTRHRYIRAVARWSWSALPFGQTECEEDLRTAGETERRERKKEGVWTKTSNCSAG